MDGVEKSDFKKYKPLYEGLRKNSRFSLMINFFVILRRLLLLYIAMFLAQYSWAQVIMFMTMSLVSLAYVGYEHPYKSRRENRVLMFNEAIILAVAYMIMVLNGLCRWSSQYQSTGELICYILYFNWCVNALIMLHTLVV